MIKNINFAKLYKPLLIFCGAVTALGMLMLLIFGGKTFAEYTMSNIRTSLIVKIAVFAVLFMLLTTIYLFLRFKKKGFWLGIFTAVGAAANSVTAFSFCVIFRASLGDITLALMLFATLTTYITALVFANKSSSVVIKKNTDKQELLQKLSKETLSVLLLPIILTITVIVVGFVIALIYSAPLFYLYALPVIFTLVLSVIFTISFTCKMFFNKI